MKTLGKWLAYFAAFAVAYVVAFTVVRMISGAL